MTADARIGVLVYDGFCAADGIGAYDVFATASRHGAPVEADLLAVGDREAVTASDGLCVDPDRIIDPADPPEVLVVPGGGWNKRAADGAWAAAQRPPTIEALQRSHRNGALLAGISTGALLIAAAGRTAGRRAVTHPAEMGELERAGARTVDARIVDDGDVVTAAGDDAGIDLALWLLEREWGPENSESVADMIEYEFTSDIAPA
jgi:transcriptional regulator GlxA family with amidase domain